jgi:AcrR family transcriptional regulator
MDEETTAAVDPRIRRTRELLQQALENLLKTRRLDTISVQEIADEARVNRATFYDHYTDKFALLECVVARRFNELLAQRNVLFDGTCGSALKAIVLAVADYLNGKRRGRNRTPQDFEPHMESAILTVLRRKILDGLEQHSGRDGIPPEIIAATVSWAIYGAAKEWAVGPKQHGADEFAQTVAALVSPILNVAGSPVTRSVRN